MSSIPKRYSHSFAQTDTDQIEASTPTIPHIPVWDHARNLDDIDHGETIDDTPYPETTPDQLVAPPDFRPFFTLIEDSETGEHLHPSVHYVFSDDDPDFITSAVLESLESTQHAQETIGANPADQTGNRERLILLDISPDGKTVKNAQSLSHEWQVSSAVIGQAPSWSEDSSRKTTAGLLLQIEGTESCKRNTPADKHQASHDDVMVRVESAITGYGDRLTALEKLVKQDVVEQENEVIEEHETEPMAGSS